MRRSEEEEALGDFVVPVQQIEAAYSSLISTPGSGKN